MCIAGTTEAVRHAQHHASDAWKPAVTRRSFFKKSVTAAAGAATLLAGGAVPAFAAGRRRGNIVDLTHRLVEGFPDFLGGDDSVESEIVFDFATAGFFAKRWSIYEHVGTHIDSPGHFTPGMALVDEIDVAALVAPIVVIDITAKATSDANAVVEPEDIRAFERTHGRIPHGALVCMRSGWDDLASHNEAYRGGTGFPDLNFPGFGIEAAELLIARRDPVAIGVDTMSLDPGNSATFDVHVGFLGSGRYGIEGLANLADIPAAGATAFVGAVPLEGGSGGPCRVIATW
jgi:kynurenine formamidase